MSWWRGVLCYNSVLKTYSTSVNGSCWGWLEFAVNLGLDHAAESFSRKAAQMDFACGEVAAMGRLVLKGGVLKGGVTCPAARPPGGYAVMISTIGGYRTFKLTLPSLCGLVASRCLMYGAPCQVEGQPRNHAHGSGTFHAQRPEFVNHTGCALPEGCSSCAITSALHKWQAHSKQHDELVERFLSHRRNMQLSPTPARCTVRSHCSLSAARRGCLQPPPNMQSRVARTPLARAAYNSSRPAASACA